MAVPLALFEILLLVVCFYCFNIPCNHLCIIIFGHSLLHRGLFFNNLSSFSSSIGDSEEGATSCVAESMLGSYLHVLYMTDSKLQVAMTILFQR